MPKDITEELKPCPFCGGSAVTWIENGWKVYCPSCGIKTPDGYSEQKYAIGFWNTRYNA